MNVAEFKALALDINSGIIVRSESDSEIELEIREYVKSTFSKLSNIDGFRVVDVQDNFGTPKVIVTFRRV